MTHSTNDALHSLYLSEGECRLHEAQNHLVSHGGPCPHELLQAGLVILSPDEPRRPEWSSVSEITARVWVFNVANTAALTHKDSTFSFLSLT